MTPASAVSCGILPVRAGHHVALHKDLVALGLTHLQDDLILTSNYI